MITILITLRFRIADNSCVNNDEVLYYGLYFTTKIKIEIPMSFILLDMQNNNSHIPHCRYFPLCSSEISRHLQLKTIGSIGISMMNCIT